MFFFIISVIYTVITIDHGLENNLNKIKDISKINNAYKDRKMQCEIQKVCLKQKSNVITNYLIQVTTFYLRFLSKYFENYVSI